MSNIVYVLTNPSIPDIVKIGMTSDLTTRMSLYTTQVYQFPLSVILPVLLMI